MTVEPFRNEPIETFQTEEARRAMREALRRVREEFGRHYPLYIGGEWVDTKERMVSLNPSAPSEVVGTTAKAGKAEAEAALEAAWKAFKTWKDWPQEDRSRLLLKAAALMRRRKRELEATLVYEVGKNWVEASADVAEAIDFIEYYARAALRYRYPAVEVVPYPGEDNESFYVPLGAGVVIAPWNFPVAIFTGMIVGPVAVGNTVIAKPAEDAVVVGAKVFEIFHEAGFPPGVVNFLPGVGEEVGAVVVQNPNFLGALEDLGPFAEAAHGAGALFVAVADPLSLGVLKPPGAYGADNAEGDGQSLGLPMGFGGPHFGFLATKKAFVRQLPGRLVSETVDVEGRRGFILTLQAREQYIRRAKAKSNITTNAQLTALMGAMYLAALGPEGLREVALKSVEMAHKLHALLLEVPGVRPFTPKPFFNEFALALPKDPEAVRRALAERGFHGATPVPREYGENLALFAATELHEEEDLLALREALKEVLA